MRLTGYGGGGQGAADENTSLSLFVAAAFYLQLLITADTGWNEDTSNQRAGGMAEDHEKATPRATRKKPGRMKRSKSKGLQGRSIDNASGADQTNMNHLCRFCLIPASVNGRRQRRGAAKVNRGPQLRKFRTAHLSIRLFFCNSSCRAGPCFMLLIRTGDT